MNTLLFSVCGFAILSFLKSSKEKQCPSFILKEAAWVFWGICLFSGLSFALRAFSGLQILEIKLSSVVILFILMLALRREISVFAAAAGLGFWVLDYSSSWSRAAGGVLAAGFLYAAFRLALWAFQRRSIFYKPAAPFAGYPLLMMQAFWVSVLLTALCLFFI